MPTIFALAFALAFALVACGFSGFRGALLDMRSLRGRQGLRGLGWFGSKRIFRK